MGNPRKDPFQRAERRHAFPAVEPPSMCCVHHQFERGCSRHLFVEEPVALHDVAISRQVPDPTIVDAQARGREGSARRDHERADGHAPRSRPARQQAQRRTSPGVRRWLPPCDLDRLSSGCAV